MVCKFTLNIVRVDRNFQGVACKREVRNIYLIFVRRIEASDHSEDLTFVWIILNWILNN